MLVDLQSERASKATTLCCEKVSLYKRTLDGYREKSGPGYEFTISNYNAWVANLKKFQEHSSDKGELGWGRECCTFCSLKTPEDVAWSWPCPEIAELSEILLATDVVDVGDLLAERSE